MLGTLIESRAARTRRTGGTLVSIAMHTGILGLAVALTTRTAQRAGPTPPAAVPVVYVNPIPRPAPAPAPPRSPATPVAPTVPRLDLPAIAPVTIPTSLPPIASSPVMNIPNWPDAASGPPVYRFPEHWHALGSGPMDGAWGADSVDRAVVPRDGNPAPVYPPMFRSAHVEGRVDVQFIVDTTGRAEPGSIEVLSSSHPRFTDAVRDAILHSRYQPASAHGVRVRQVVAQRFEFALKN